MNWYITTGGLCWKRIIEILSNRLGICEVVLYDGSRVKGKPRQTKDGLLVMAL